MSRTPKPTLEQALDQKKVNDWYTLVLIRVTGSHDKEIMATYADDKKVRMRIFDWRNWQMITITDRKNKILGQLPLKYFVKQ